MSRWSKWMLGHRRLVRAYGNGGAELPLVPVIGLPQGTTVEDPAARRALGQAFGALARQPGTRVVSYASSGEVYDRTGSTTAAVVESIGRTGRLVTSAALILLLALASLATGPIVTVKVFATGLGAGILLDATVVRVLLVPALVSLFGRWNWWLPAWAARPLGRKPAPVTTDGELVGARDGGVGVRTLQGDAVTMRGHVGDRGGPGGGTFADAAGLDAAALGTRAANLVRLAAAGLPLLRGLVVIAQAERNWPALRPCRLEAAAWLGGQRFAVRSPAAAEDLAEASFAGQEQTVPYVPHRARRGGPVSARLGRRRAGPPKARTGWRCLVQVMIKAAASGVAFSANPQHLGERRLPLEGARHAAVPAR